MHETFWTLLHDGAHWEFELFLMALFDGLVGAILWPLIRKHWGHHIARDKREGTILSKELKRVLAQSSKPMYIGYMNDHGVN